MFIREIIFSYKFHEVWFSIDCATIEVAYQITIQRGMDNKTIQHGSQKLKSNQKITNCLGL